LAAVVHCCERYPAIAKDWRLPSGFNPTLAGSGPWFSEGYFGLDQGIIVLMIENYCSQLLWKLMRQSPYIKIGLERAAFRGGWL